MSDTQPTRGYILSYVPEAHGSSNRVFLTITLVTEDNKEIVVKTDTAALESMITSARNEIDLERQEAVSDAEDAMTSANTS